MSTTTVDELRPNLRERVRALIENPRFDQMIIALIVLNAITLGMEAVPSLESRYAPVLSAFDHFALWVLSLIHI